MRTLLPSVFSAPPTPCTNCGGQCGGFVARCTGKPASTILRGRMPIVMALCPDDLITEPGRISEAYVPEFVAVNSFQRAATFSPRDSLQATGTYSTIPINLDIALADPAGGAARERLLFPGFTLDVMSSNNTPPGKSSLTVAGIFEDNIAWTQTFQVKTGHIGMSTFIILSSREVQGGAYPQPFVIDNGSLVGATAAAADVFATVRTLRVTVNSAPPGTAFTVEPLTPVSEEWYAALDAWYADAKPGA